MPERPKLYGIHFFEVSVIFSLSINTSPPQVGGPVKKQMPGTASMLFEMAGTEGKLKIKFALLHSLSHSWAFSILLYLRYIAQCKAHLNGKSVRHTITYDLIRSIVSSF